MQSHIRPLWIVAVLATSITGGALCASETSGPKPQPTLHEFESIQPKMGTVFRLLIWAQDKQTADDAAHAAWTRVDQLNAALSDYDPDSELNRLCRLTDHGPMPQPFHVGEDLFAILTYSMEAARLSGGAFDVTIGPLTRLQRQSRKTGKLPTPQQLKQAMQSVSWQYMRLFPDGERVQLLHEKMQLDVGGIAKGFTSDEVLKLLRQRGITRALCGAAGDIAVGDPPPGRDDWRIAIQSLKSPDQISGYVKLHLYGISTSGDTYRSAVVGGVRYSHIIDPRTGLGLTRRIGVTTIAPRGVVADWAATAVSVLGPQKGLEMIERLRGAAARVVTLDEKGNEHVSESRTFSQFLAEQNAASAPAGTQVQ